MTLHRVVIDAILHKFAIGGIDVVAHLDSLRGREVISGEDIEPQLRKALQRVGHKAHIEVVDTQTALSEDIAILKLLALSLLKGLIEECHIWLLDNDNSHDIVALIEVGRDKEVGRRKLVDRRCYLLAIHKDTKVGTHALDMEVGVVVVPRCGHLDMLLIDTAHSTLLGLELQLRAKGDMLVDIGANIALGILALVVGEKLCAGNACLSLGNNGQKKSHKGEQKRGISIGFHSINRLLNITKIQKTAQLAIVCKKISNFARLSAILYGRYTPMIQTNKTK